MPTSAVAITLPFVHPGLAAAAIGLGSIPILVHFINRQRHIRTPWAAMALLLHARRRTARRVRLEQFLLLAARIAVIVLAGLAVARPYLSASTVSPLLPSRTHRVLLIDNSLSMRAADPTSAGATRFSMARAGAERLLQTLPDGDLISVITLASPAEDLIGQPSYDHRLLRERVANIEATQRADDIIGGLDMSLAALRSSEVAPENRAFYLFSDLARTAWVAAPGAPSGAAVALRRMADELPIPERNLHVVRCASAEIRNVALTDLSGESFVGGIRAPVRVRADIRNFGDTSVSGVAVEFRRDGKTHWRESLPTIEPRGSQSCEASFEFASPGTHTIEARLSGLTADALPDDNERFLSLDIRERTSVLLVDGRPGLTPLSGEAGFLAAALSPAESTARHGSAVPRPDAPESPIETKVISEAELLTEPLVDHAVVAFCNVQRLAPEVWRAVERFVFRGGGLLVFAGDLIQPENYNRLGYAEGNGVLPGEFHHEPFVRAPNGSDAPGSFVTIQQRALTHPVVSGFAAETLSGLFTARIRGYFPFKPDAQRGEVLLRYSNDEPALISGKHGQGRVVVCTTGANMAWSNLPAKGDYVSLMLETVSHLTPNRGNERNVFVGQSIKEQLSAAEASLPVQALDAAGRPIASSLVARGDGIALSTAPIASAGVGTVQVGPEARHFAANIDAVESDPSTMDEAEFRAALARPMRFVHGDQDAAMDSTKSAVNEFSRAGFYAVGLLLLIEMWMAMSFGRQKA